MNQKDLIERMAELLGKAGVEYMVTGGYGVIFYGRPRFSHDVDFVVNIGERELPKVVKIFEENDVEFSWQRLAIEEAVERKGMFDVLHLPTMTKVDFWLLKDTEFEREKFGRRKTMVMGGQPVVLASAEDLVVQKLVWYTKAKIEKHIVDAAFVWQIQGPKLDKAYIRKWAKKLRVEKYLVKLDKIDIEEHY